MNIMHTLERIKTTLLLLLITSPFIGLAQELSISVNDTLQNPIQQATVTLYWKNYLKKSETDALGQVKIPLNSKEDYHISVSHVDYQEASFQINKPTNKIEKTIVLSKNETILLNDVIAKADNSIVYKQDTVIYLLDSFTNKSERKLKHALRKLPGVRVENGKVTVNGSVIKKIYVENKEFFGGSTNLALDNLPAKAVEKVEVIDNHSESGLLNELDLPSDNKVINVSLKEDSKNLVFGDAHVGLGVEKKYNFGTNMFYYGKQSVNFISKFNNHGETALTVQDFLRFNGGVSRIIKDIDKFFSSDSFQELLLLTRQNDYEKRVERFSGLNFSNSLSDKIEFQSYLIFDDLDLSSRSINNYQYILESGTLREERETKENLRNKNYIFQINSVYKRNTNTEFFYDMLLKNRTSHQDSRMMQSYADTNSSAYQSKQAVLLSIKQNLEMHHKYNHKNYGFFGLNIELENSEDQLLINEANPNTIIAVENDEVSEFKQDIDKEKFNADFSYKHAYKFNSNWSITTDFSLYFQKLKYDSNISYLEDNQFISAGADYLNDSDFKRYSVNLIPYLSFNKNKIRTNFGFGIYYLNHKKNNTNKSNNLNFQTDINIEYHFRKSEKLFFRYSYLPKEIDFTNYLENYVLFSPFYLFKGNENLGLETNHNVSLKYNKSIKYYKLWLNTKFSFLKTSKGLVNYIRQTQVNQVSEPIILKNPKNSWRFSYDIEKGLFKNLNLILEQEVSNDNYTILTNSYLLKNQRLRFLTKFGLKHFSEKLEIESHLKYNKKWFESSDSKRITQNLSQHLSLKYQFYKFFDFSVNVENTNFSSDNGSKNQFLLGGLGMGYFNQDKAFSFSINVENVFNTQSRVFNTFSEQIISEVETFIQPRYLLVKFMWNI